MILFALLCASAAQAQERKAYADVDFGEMMREMQAVHADDDSLNMVMWFPAEYWEVNLAKDPYVSRAQADELMDLLGTYSILGVIQGDVALATGFAFLERDEVAEGLTIEYTDASGEAHGIPHDIGINDKLRELLDMVGPMLESGMGEMGRNMHFFPVPDRTNEGRRIVSPYDKGVLRFDLAAHDDGPAPSLSLEFPMNALFVPRLCPNGKPAHVSWSYCPWGGEKLE
jgi:hypothetical protein